MVNWLRLKRFRLVATTAPSMQLPYLLDWLARITSAPVILISFALSGPTFWLR